MGEIYSDLNSDFPYKVSTMNRVQDVTLSAKPYVDLYNQYYSQGDFTRANQVINEHPELLSMMLNMKLVNQIIDEIKATQRTFRDDVESYIFTIIKLKGEYSGAVKYVKYNIVYYNLQPYMAIADDIPIGTLPTNINYWYPLAIKGDQGESGLGLTPRGAWSDVVQYYQDDMVAYNNILWAALSNNINYIPSESSPVWLKLLAFSSEYLSYDNSRSGLIANTMQGAIDEIISVPISNINSSISSINTSLSNKSNLDHLQALNKGGTGATTAEAARTNLGVAYGTTAGTVCQGNDSRLSNSRTPIAHNQAASTITAGTFAGQVISPVGTDYTTNRIRNIVFTTTDPGANVSSSYVNGSIIMVYE